jgi:signal transduction histidine kinase
VLFELCTNSVKHAGATNIAVCVRVIDDTLRGPCLEIRFEDDGSVTVVTSNGSGLGHRSVERRMKELGGSQELEHAYGQGWRYRLVIPLTRLGGTGLAASN